MKSNENVTIPRSVEQALEAMENCRVEYDYHGRPMGIPDRDVIEARTALRAITVPLRLPKDAVICVASSIGIQFLDENLDEQIDDIFVFARAIERAHGIGGEE